MSKNTIVELGQLVPISLREVWPDEAKHFTPWLAERESLELLSKAIGVDLEFESHEVSCGRYFADLQCKDLSNDSWVVIENQLEGTDHKHLGQLLTYAAGLDAKTLVWIAKHFTEEHRAAIDLLNDSTGVGFKYFGIEIRVWKIGDSAYAPEFSVVCQPNGWTKTARIKGDETEMDRKKIRYWEGLRKLLDESGKIQSNQKAWPENELYFTTGHGDFRVRARIGGRKGGVCVQFVILNGLAGEHFRKLAEKRAAIENELRFELEWNEVENQTERQLEVRLAVENPLDSPWETQYEWLALHIEAMHRVFVPIIKDYPKSKNAPK